MEELLSEIYRLKNSERLNDKVYYDLIYERINDLLEHEINQLFHVLYRIDISEIIVKNIFQEHSENKEISNQLTRAVIARIQQKIDLRNNYSNKT